MNSIENCKRNNWYETIIKYLCIISLFFSFTNYIFISAVASLTVIFFIPLLFRNGGRINYIAFSVLCFYLLSIVSGIIIQPAQFLSFEFYRRDGNLFISFTPLLILCLCNIKFDVWKTVAFFVLISTVADFAGIVFHLIKRSTSEYFMWFTAHNAAGGFLSIICIATIFVILHYFKNGFAVLLFSACFIINFVGLYLTKSRGSFLTFILAILIFILMKKIKRIDIIIFTVIFVIFFTMELYVVEVMGESAIESATQYEIPEEFQNDKFFSNVLSLFIMRSHTVVDRIFCIWSKAIYLFLKSPIIGVGFGGYNDVEYNLIGIENVIMINASEQVASNSSHAHNTFFHVLAEQGIIGFILLLVMIFQMKKTILKEKDEKLRAMLLIMFLYAIGSSFFEHRFFTPAQMIPFLLILGMTISTRNYYGKYVDKGKKLY